MEPAAATTGPAAGWFADPHLPDILRWWDGAQWTHHTHPAATAAPAHHAPQAQTAQIHQPTASAFPTHGAYTTKASPLGTTSGVATTSAVSPSGGPSLTKDNPKSTAAVIVSGLYLVLAMTTGIVLAGFVPAIFTFRAFEGREKLAPAALAATAIAVGFAFTHLNR